MASSLALWREISWLHEERLLFSLRSVIDYFNLLAAFILYVVLLVTRRSSFRERRRDWFSIVILGCCVLVSIGYFGAAIHSFAALGEESSRLVWFGRGIVWTTLCVSVIARGSRLIDVVKSVWWILFFLLISAFNIVELVKFHDIEILEIAPWLANLLLLFCGLRNLQGIVSHQVLDLDSNLSESLLVRTSGKGCFDFDEASLLSILLFSWINPLLKLGSSKSLNLDDIPSLGSEDEALLAYKSFGDAWSVLEEEKGTKNSTFWAIARVYWKCMVLAGICLLLRTVCVVATPLFLYAFVNYSNLEEKDLEKGVFLV
ncbi:hypothetical protein SASPL_110068 [Salvia splendens]|uniref:Uncharacterized protein n=1 Tax=Salvia splendens TaxID=180675 RepID=A0A8X9A2F0_SALSN|nr:hypothetical protein SASPL_110068 [Salvia splendens]